MSDPLILIVDDDDDICAAVAMVLEDHGYRVASAHDGAQALAVLDDGGVGLILLDLMMPGMSGEEFLRALRKTPSANIPIVVMSGQGDVREKCRLLGAPHFLLKPVEARDLLAAAHRFLGGALGAHAAH